MASTGRQREREGARGKDRGRRNIFHIEYKCDSSYLKSLQRWHHDIRYLLPHHNIPPYIRDTQPSMCIHHPVVTHMHTVEYTLHLSV